RGVPRAIRSFTTRRSSDLGRGARLMARAKVQYACTACGGVSVKWQGQCPHCAEWNTLEESIAEPRGAAGRFQSLAPAQAVVAIRSEEHTSELQSRENLVGR